MLFDVLSAFAADAPDVPALVCGGRQFRAADLVHLADRWTATLRAGGSKDVALAMRQPAECIAAMAALSRLQGSALLLKDGLAAQEIEGLMQRLGCEALVCDAATLSALPPELRAGAIVLAQGTGTAAAAPVQALPAAPEGEIRILTSGTTGAPKSIGHRWRDLVAATRIDRAAAPRRWLLAYSLAHFAGLQVLLQSLLHRDTLVAADNAQVPDLWAAAVAGRVTHLSSTPTFWRVAFAAAVRQPIPSLRHVTLGGEVVTQDVLDRIAALYPHAAISQIYASTELGSVVSVRDRRAGLPLHLFDDAAPGGALLRIAESELQVRHADGAHAAYRATGDLVERQADRVVFLGRKSETINVGGFKVHPQQVEAVVSPIRGVLAAVAEGRPNPITGQIVRLRVVLRHGHHRDEVDAEIRSACRSLSRHAQPRQILYVDALETTNMKLARRTP